MTAITVRTMLAVILENNLQMDDEIHFQLSPEAYEIGGIKYELHMSPSECIQENEGESKQFKFSFYCLEAESEEE